MLPLLKKTRGVGGRERETVNYRIYKKVLELQERLRGSREEKSV